MERQAAEETQIIFVGFASSDIAIERDNSDVVHDITGKIFATTDGMITEFPYEPSNIRHEIHNPFRVRPLLAYPLQEIDVVYLFIQAVQIILIGDQERLF